MTVSVFLGKGDGTSPQAGLTSRQTVPYAPPVVDNKARKRIYKLTRRSRWNHVCNGFHDDWPHGTGTCTKTKRVASRLTDGWTISGTTRFSTGFPVTMYNNTDSSLLGTFGNGVNNDLVDTPTLTPGPLQIHTNPRDGKPAFNASLFALPALGQLGTSARRFFYGPGVENFDMTLAKRLNLSEGKSLQFRLEAFNVFNHAQFCGPASVDGNISSSTFGQVVSAASPRLVQLATKLNF